MGTEACGWRTLRTKISLELGPLSGSVLRTFSLDVHPTSIALADGLDMGGGL